MTGEKSFKELVRGGIPKHLPPKREIDPNVDHAPPRPMNLDRGSFSLAIENALRYFPKSSSLPKCKFCCQSFPPAAGSSGLFYSAPTYNYAYLFQQEQ